MIKTKSATGNRSSTRRSSQHRSSQHRSSQHRSSQRRSAKRHGSVLLEAALVSIFILIPLTLAIIQYGIVFNAINTLSQVTREGARAAAVYALKKSTDNPGPGLDSDSYIRSRIQNAAASTSLDMSTRAINAGEVQISISPPMGDAARVAGMPIAVSISYSMKKKYFFPWLSGGQAGSNGGGFVGMPARIARTATMMIE